MSNQDYPEPDDDWEREYAYYLERRMEEQYWEEQEAQYNLQLCSEYEGCLDDEEVVITGLNNSDMTFTVMNPEDYNTLHETHPDDIAHRILHLPMEDNDAQAATVGEYLGLLLSTLWLQADGFSSKRPFGNSDWTTPVYLALGKAGLSNFSLDENGYIEDFSLEDESATDELILQAIRFAYYHQ